MPPTGVVVATYSANVAVWERPLTNWQSITYVSARLGRLPGKTGHTPLLEQSTSGCTRLNTQCTASGVAHVASP